MTVCLLKFVHRQWGLFYFYSKFIIESNFDIKSFGKDNIPKIFCPVEKVTFDIIENASLISEKNICFVFLSKIEQIVNITAKISFLPIPFT